MAKTPARARGPRGPMDEATVTDALAMIEAGEFVRHACAEHGISIRTWEDRVARDEDFAARVARARARGERVRLSRAREDVDEGRSPHLEMWVLERLNPAAYRPPPTESVQHVTVEDNARAVWDALAEAAERGRND